MDIQVTETAKTYIETLAGSESAIIRLAYDSEGCGCGVNGLPALWIVSAKETDDLEIQSNRLHFVIHRLQAVFFEEHLYLDSEKNDPSFRLTGDGQLYGQNIRLVDKR
ncbi:iron-sulfur cluster biosynthesis family protein [Paenibacillus sp. XY044]|uniref:iron-sulfur cluster biosynthesis family protein n=1 Tax=Paenibacillus sp. XY044 TaxID=2026089 RepID=UPI0015C5D5C1|nr:iron-sulfur cluster biosynthesis family protein [Paenibacillus sp. XY044]